MLEVGPAHGGLSYAVSAWAPGEPLDGLSEPGLRAALPSLLDAMDAIRALPPPGPEGFGMWRSDGRTPHRSWRAALLALVEEEELPRAAGWRAFLRAEPEWAARFDASAAALAELAGACPPGVRHVVHADLTAGNVLVADGRVTAVLDWGNSLVGDFLYDVAWLVFRSPWHPGLDADLVLAETRRRCAASGDDLSHFEERLRACGLHIGLDSLAYNAFRHDAVNLRGTLGRMRELFSL